MTHQTTIRYCVAGGPPGLHSTPEAARIAYLEAEVGRLRTLALDLADELSAEVEARYPEAERSRYPTSQRRYDNEMKLVREAWRMRG